MGYFDELIRAMTMLAENPQVIFLGQSVACPGNAIYNTLRDIPIERRIEMPVAEELQMGMSIGLALGGYIPVSIFPRFDFLLLAVNQLVNHLDKFEAMTGVLPKVIIRTAVGSTKPLHPGPQHCQDYTKAFKLLLKNVSIYSLKRAKDIVPCYQRALSSDRSSLIIEQADLYGK